MTAKRITKEQQQVYLHYLEENPVLVHGKSNDKDVIKKIWVGLVNDLNASGTGPSKNAESWKKTFTDWKSITRKRVRMGGTLNEHEAKLLKLTGEAAATGVANVPQLGLPTPGTSATLPIVNLQDVLVEEGITIEVIEEEDDEGEGGDVNVSKEQEAPVTSGDKNGENVNVNSKSGTRKQRAKPANPLLNAYNDNIQNELSGLNNIAAALNAIASSINRLGDVIEQQSSIDSM